MCACLCTFCAVNTVSNSSECSRYSRTQSFVQLNICLLIRLCLQTLAPLSILSPIQYTSTQSLTHSLIYSNIQPSDHLTLYLPNLNIHHTAEYIVTEQAKGSFSASFSPNPSHLGIAMAREAALNASPIFHSAPAAGEISLW